MFLPVASSLQTVVRKLSFLRSLVDWEVESVQDFLIKLDMKPCMHLVEISIFSLNLVIVRLTKIMNQFLTQKNDFETMNFDMFERVVHNFGKSDDDII